MKTIFKILPIFILIFTLSSSLAFPQEIPEIEIKDKTSFLFDARGDDGDIFSNHLSLHKKLDWFDIDAFAFNEMQWNFDVTTWEKITLGIGAEKKFWKYLYFSQTIQYISGEILDYMKIHNDNHSFDATSKIGFYVPLIKNFVLDVCEEYSFNVEEGEEAYCESIAEIIYSPKDFYSVGFGWRHTDRIHNFDTDYVTTSLTLRF